MSCPEASIDGGLAVPTTAASHNELGFGHLEAGQRTEACACFRRAIALEPKVGLYHENLGIALLDLGQTQEAAASFLNALALDPNLFLSLLNMARIMAAAAQTRDAEEYFRRALSANPDSYQARCYRCQALLEAGEIERAEAVAREAIELRPQEPQAYLVLGSILRQRGLFPAAVDAYRTAMSHDPRVSASALHGLVASKRFAESDRPELETMLALVEDGRVSARDTLLLHASLGKAYDELGEYGAAMRHYESARLVAASQNSERFDRRAAEITPALCRKFFPKGVFDVFPSRLETDLPLLIVGLPRSGTTLLEQILSSHPKIGAGGELRYWHNTGLARDPRRVFNPAFAGEAGLGYRRLLREIGPTMRRVTDKMPNNYMLLGPLHLMFPNASIVHCRRHPVDTCLSILMNTLALTPPPNYVFDLEDTVACYREYEAVMAHWREILPPDRFIEVEYRELVLDREATTRKLIEFCGLEWSDSCLAHEANERAVTTPSQWQVRQPIYATSMDRWRNYGPWLGPLSELLTEEERSSVTTAT